MHGCSGNSKSEIDGDQFGELLVVPSEVPPAHKLIPPKTRVL